jgi:blue copper oxidase
VWRREGRKSMKTSDWSRRKYISRRQFLLWSGLGLAGTGLGACTAGRWRVTVDRIAENESVNASPGAAKSAGLALALAAAPLEIELTAQPDEMPMLDGQQTHVYRYEGQVLQGDPAALQTLPGSYVGPIIRAERGQLVRVHFQNQLPVETNIHWHGLLVPPQMDGHPHDLVPPGGQFLYEFEVRNPAGTYWFHPHKHGDTGAQINMGLTGLLIVRDEMEKAVRLPSGDQDVALVIQDRQFDGDNQFAYLAGMMGGMMGQMMGFLGDHILVNGRPHAVLIVATRAYRLRLLNASNSRIYKLAWSNGQPLTVLATEGGLLAQPVTRPYVTLASGERLEVWADFSGLATGTEVKLQSLAFEGVEAAMEMGGMMHGASTLSNGAAFEVLTVRVEREEEDDAVLPAVLVPVERLETSEAGNAGQPRRFVLAMTGPMQWTINGRSFEMDDVAVDEQVKLGTTEIWEFANVMEPPAGGRGMGGHGMGGHGMMGQGMMGQGMMRDFMAHPMHVHGIQFRVVSRQVDEPQRAGWETLRAGYVDEGWKDTVLVMPGEHVQLLMRFEDYPGLFIYHCHNLEHSDMGMMRNYIIRQ